MGDSTFDLANLQPALRTTAKQDNLRPIVTSLNGDNSWLWSFPRPALKQNTSGKAYYHIVFEPWLNGPTGLISSWWIHLTHAKPPAVTTAEGVDDIIRDIETACSPSGDEEVSTAQEPLVDAILLGFHYLDHIHAPTLRLFDKRIPVIVSPEGAGIVRSLDHFEAISIIPDLPPTASTWQDLPRPAGLPAWLTPFRMLGHHELNYVFTLIWTHTPPNSGKAKHEALFHSPHGTLLDQQPLQTFVAASPSVEPMALFHGLKESHAAGMKNTYGAENGLALYRLLKSPKYWVLSHNSALGYSGIVMRLLWVQDTPRTMEWALQAEAKSAGGEQGSAPRLVDVENGRAFILV